MLHLDGHEISQQYLHRIMLGSVAPRPIAFASTIDLNGNPNLSPFSFFNAFGVNPGTLIFSPSRRGRDNTTKHTFQNLKELPEVVINVVNYEMVQQMSLASCEYPKGVNEFIKAGFTPIPSEIVKPFRVKESPVQFECKVRQIIETGDGPGAGNLVICDILMVHLAEEILTDQGEIDQDKIDLVGRLGGDFYVRTNQAARFLVPKPVAKTGIGIDALPDKIKHNHALSGNDLGQLGNLEKFPLEADILIFKKDPSLKKRYKENSELLYIDAKRKLEEGYPFDALSLLLSQLS
ncbi:MAG: flavin reductase [Bacteroidetes bacterium HGW-Bacteroidetes-1]|jgi:flavin reductase (DIM6/NTAB) family NADH-FMN oxidoreductase RutF|nr:MAG: flavin reductase [Bacteroidetes bacterium HGW-Bacteroidetes-1]